MLTPASKPLRLMSMKSCHGPWNQVAVIHPSGCQTVAKRSQSPASRHTTQFSTVSRMEVSCVPDVFSLGRSAIRNVLRYRPSAGCAKQKAGTGNLEHGTRKKVIGNR